MSNDIWNKKREKLENAVQEAVLNLFGHMGGAGSCVIKIPNTTPPVFIIVGDNKALYRLVVENTT